MALYLNNRFLPNNSHIQRTGQVPSEVNYLKLMGVIGHIAEPYRGTYLTIIVGAARRQSKAMEISRDLDSVQKVSLVIDALKSGQLKVREQDEDWVRELLALPRGFMGQVDITPLSPEVLSIARAMAIGLSHFKQEQDEHASSRTLGLHDAQCELFRLFEKLFIALVGVPSDTVSLTAEIKARLLERVRNSNHRFVDEVNTTADEIEEFYQENAISIFRAAKSLGGVKVVTGGQRQYGASALTATRIAGLYCDTQLIPDPIYPFFTGDLHLNAMHLQLAIVLFHILPLRPLVDARFPEPPIFIFPSFEESLEERDVITKSGIASLLVKVVAPACNSKLHTIEELFEYARRDEQSFIDAISRERLFVPPGGDPENIGSAQESVRIYLRELQGIRSTQQLSELGKQPLGIIVLNAILERLRPQYHLLENAEELTAQPMLSQRVHWYYFERCALAEAHNLINKRVLSRESLDVLRALQDDSLKWLANIPIDGLVELRSNLEHAEFREKLKSCTSQLTSAGPSELEAVTREVRHGLEVMIQQQQVAIRAIEAKYSTKKWATIAGAGLGAAVGASMFFMPTFAAAVGVTPSEASVIGGLGAGGIELTKALAGQFIEKRQARRTLLGLLATVHRP